MSTLIEHKYDAFISYSHKDQDWVRNTLLPTIEKNGIKAIIDFRDFVPGAPSLREMERAIKDSRKTIIVLTPNYVNSAWAEFEAVLAGTLDPAGGERKILPILLENCDIPPYISYLTYLNFTDSANISLEWDKLFSSFNNKPSEPNRQSFTSLKTERETLKQNKIVNAIGIPTVLYNRCRKAFLKCREFENLETLRTLFIIDELYPFRDGLRNADNKSSLVDKNLEYFIDQKLTGGKTVLHIVIDVLIERSIRGTEVRDELLELKNILNSPYPKTAINHVENIETENRLLKMLDELISRINNLQNELGSQFADIKTGLRHIYQRIQPEDSMALEKILEEVHRGRIEQSEVRNTVESTRRALKYVLETGIKINDPQVEKAIAEIYQSINSSLTLEEKFELTIPIIPLLLEYKVALGAGVDLQAVWDEFVQRFRK